ncbi:MAG TPA: CPBP family intramembrane glutamic endopeptidase [Terriglobia bacterium]|nr:CPBP family intramembrane glutamic endopeptidase [Terriglobia bacterium]
MPAKIRRNGVDIDAVSTISSQPHSLLKFFLMVFALSIPFWIAGTLTGPQLLPGLPIAALMFVCPITAAVILVYQENKAAGVAALFRRVLVPRCSRMKMWHVPTLLFMPGIMILEYTWMRYRGAPLPIPRFPVAATLTMSLAFLVAALCEEFGWSGYAIDPMQERWGALSASVLLGSVWAIWHVVPLVQAHRSLGWITWWCFGTVAARILIVWLYNNTGRSILPVSLFHAMGNVVWQLFPIRGSYFDPRVNAVIIALAAVVVVVVWSPQTLAGYKKRCLG